MPPEIVDTIAPLIALLGLGTFSLIGLRMFLAYRTRRLELGAGRGDAGRVDELVEELRAELQQLRGDVTELHERMDFTERVLTRGHGTEPAAGKRDA
jgi:hypothetical protein